MLGSENCNVASVCLSSGLWNTSSQCKIDLVAIFVQNLIQLKPHRATKMASAIVFLALPKVSSITDNIAIILKILSIIAIKIVPIIGNPSVDNTNRGLTVFQKSWVYLILVSKTMDNEV